MTVKANPQIMAQRWAQGMSGATTRYTEGVQAVRVAPGQLAAAQAGAWVQAVTASQQRFAQRVAGVSLQSWQQSAINKGAPRLATGAAASQDKFQAFANNFLPALANIVNGLPPRGTFESNVARLTQYIQAVHGLKGNVS